MNIRRMLEQYMSICWSAHPVGSRRASRQEAGVGKVAAARLKCGVRRRRTLPRALFRVHTMQRAPTRESGNIRHRAVARAPLAQRAIARRRLRLRAPAESSERAPAVRRAVGAAGRRPAAPGNSARVESDTLEPNCLIECTEHSGGGAECSRLSTSTPRRHPF